MPKPIRRTPPRHRDDSHPRRGSRVRRPDALHPCGGAQRLQTRESWLRKQAAARQVPCTFLGEHLRFSTADLAAIIAAAARAPVGRKPRRRPVSGVRDDLPAAPPRSVHAHRDDHQPEGSSPWPG